MTNSKHVPKRRFKEFESDGEWEQNQLKELAEFSKGRGYSKSELQTDGQPIILYGRLYTKYETVISTVDTFTHIKENSVLSKGGEVLVPSSGESAEDIARASVVAEEGIIIGGDLNIIKLCKKIEPIFLSLAISNGKQKEEISKRAQGKSVVHVNNDDLKQVNVLFPSISEQIQIGKFFQTIDALISNHQHKLDKLKNLKKAYLSEMFPAEGERVPKRRFPGFEGEWEQKRLATIASMHARIGWQNLRTSEFLNDGDYYLITGTDFLDGRINFDNCYYVDKERYQQDKNIQVKTGSILITKDGTIGKVAIVGHLDKPATLNAGVFNVVIKESNVDEKYLYQYLASPFLMDYVSKRVTGGTIKHLNQGILVDFPINIPTYEEQKAIGKFFEHLDQSITLQQQKLDKLNDLKKAYLNELFV